MKIQDAALSDVPALADVAREAFQAAYRDILSPEQLAYDLDRGYSEAAFRRQMTEDEHRFIVLRENGAITGFASFSPSETHARRSYLHKLYLRPDLKGRGHGRQLLLFVVSEAGKTGYEAVELTVNRNNAAVTFYQKLGFEIEAELDIPIGNGYFRNDYRMVAPVQPVHAP